MGVRTMTVSGFGTVVESVGSIPSSSSAAALTTTSNVCDADNVVINTSGGATINFFLDVTISNHKITYASANANQTSRAETRTVREHEFAHVGARNGFGSATAIKALCDDVKVKWSAKAKTQAEVNEKITAYEDAIENYLSPMLDYFDELVVHKVQRASGKFVGMPTEVDLKATRGTFEYLDPETGASRKPSDTAIATMEKSCAAGAKLGEAFAKAHAAPKAVVP